MEQANFEFHQRVRQGFQELAALDPERIVDIDASRSLMEVSQQIQTVLTQHLTAWYGPLLAG
jgi:dTMP kinase